VRTAQTNASEVDRIAVGCRTGSPADTDAPVRAADVGIPLHVAIGAHRPIEKSEDFGFVLQIIQPKRNVI
jgi:hypothetical protein